LPYNVLKGLIIWELLTLAINNPCTTYCIIWSWRSSKHSKSWSCQINLMKQSLFSSINSLTSIHKKKMGNQIVYRYLRYKEDGPP
jgi:N6-adenosine-specific RNA methylase IME4